MFLLFFEKSSSFCRENEIFKNKKNKETKEIDQFFNTKKAKIGPILTLQHICCIYRVVLK